MDVSDEIQMRVEVNSLDAGVDDERAVRAGLVRRRGQRSHPVLL